MFQWMDHWLVSVLLVIGAAIFIYRFANRPPDKDINKPDPVKEDEDRKPE